MSSDNILIVKNSSILFIRLIVTTIIGLLTSRIVIQSLGASDFGLYSVVGSIVVMMVFLNNVMMSSTYRFIAYEIGIGNDEGINKVFNISLVIHICIALVILLMTETIGVYYVNNYLNVEPEKITDALLVLRFSTYATMLSVFSIPFQGLITAKENFKTTATIEVIRSILGIIVAFTIMHYAGNRLKLYAVLISIINIVPPILYLVYCKHKYKKVVQWNFQRDKSKYKEMIAFSGWIMFGAAAGVGKTSGSALIINGFFGTLLNAAFGIANQVNNFVMIFAGSLGQAAIPQITKNFSSGNTSRTVNLAVYISKYSFFLMLIPALPVFLETEYLLTLWLGKLPPFTVIFSRLVIINGLIESLGGVGAIAQATGKIKYFQIVLSSSTLLSLPLAYVFLKLGYPPPSILIAFIMMTSINLFLSLFLLKKIIDFDIIFYLKTVHLRVFYIVSLMSIPFFVRDMFPQGIYRFIIISGISIIWLLVTIFFVGIEKKERVLTGQLVTSLIKKRSR